MAVASVGKSVRTKALLFAAASGSLACLCQLATASSGHSVKLDASVVKLQANIPALMKQADIPGMSIAVVRNGRVAWHGNFGVKNTKTAQPVDDNTVFEAASLSKPVFAYAVLKLVEQGKIGLDVPLTTYLAKPYIADDRLKEITARFVLSHRTGFPNWRGEGNPLTIHFTPG